MIDTNNNETYYNEKKVIKNLKKQKKYLIPFSNLTSPNKNKKQIEIESMFIGIESLCMPSFKQEKSPIFLGSIWNIFEKFWAWNFSKSFKFQHFLDDNKLNVG